MNAGFKPDAIQVKRKDMKDWTLHYVAVRLRELFLNAFSSSIDLNALDSVNEVPIETVMTKFVISGPYGTGNRVDSFQLGDGLDGNKFIVAGMRSSHMYNCEGEFVSSSSIE